MQWLASINYRYLGQVMQQGMGSHNAVLGRVINYLPNTCGTACAAPAKSTC